MELNLKDKVYFIAGSTQGIGLGIGKAFLAEGARVVITGRDQQRLDDVVTELSQQHGEKNLLALSGDLTDPYHIRRSLDATHARWGRLDGVVANLGSGAEPLGVPEDEELWQKSFDLNCKASLQQVQIAIPYLAQQGGSVTFISSIAGIESIRAPIAYSMNKAGLNAAAKQLARAVAKDNIRVNVVAPGNILAPGGTWERKLHENREQVEAYLETQVPLKCLGEPQDVAALCVFLASNQAKFITGSTIIVDGGQTNRF